MTRPPPPETKVAASAVIGYAVSLVLQLLAVYLPHFSPPPATAVALIVTSLSAVAGYLAPHTSRTPLPPGSTAPPEGTTP